ncbi:MAG: hypothetical protein CML08_00655 [Puniceicoccaceae bacterium]|nr:hypothetical protein [Puniceicoccaceae bacterium]
MDRTIAPRKHSPRRHFPLIQRRVTRSIALLALFSHLAVGDYRPLETRKTWTFSRPTPAYAEPERRTHLGDFQPGITVRLLRTLTEDKLWKVAYDRPQQAAIEAYIESPTSTRREENSRDLKEAQSVLAEFPLLDSLLKSPEPWAIPIQTLQQDYLQIPLNTIPEAELLESLGTLDKALHQLPTEFLHLIQINTQHLNYWSWTPAEIYIDYREPNNQKITINLWNKSDSSIRWNRAFPQLQETKARLSQVETLLGSKGYQQDRQSPRPSHAITALRNNEAFYYLANDLMIRLRWSRQEFISIDLLSYRQQRERQEQPNYGQNYSKHEFTRRTQNSVTTHPDGHCYIDAIPMIDQGEKGYCAAATLARILQYYGYPISMHAIGELAQTTAEGGTYDDDLFNSIRRFCNSTPFKITRFKNPRRDALLSYIERGIPLYWLIPGHARLINGVHPEGGIIYSDSWGFGHEFKKMTWSEFKNLNDLVFAIELK